MTNDREIFDVKDGKLETEIGKIKQTICDANYVVKKLTLAHMANLQLKINQCFGVGRLYCDSRYRRC